MKVLISILLLLSLLCIASAYEEDEWSDSAYSWRLGTNDSLPVTEVIVDPYGSGCTCP